MAGLEVDGSANHVQTTESLSAKSHALPMCDNP